MKNIILISTLFLFHGCLYFNDRGMSGHLYDNCHSYYDANGEFVETCDENIIDYDEAQEGVIALKDEIKEDVTNLSNNIQKQVNSITTNNSNKTGIKLEELTQKEKAQLKILQPAPKPIIKIEEQIELNQCPCR